MGLLFCNCGSILSNTKRLPAGGFRPIRPNFSLAKEPYHLHEGDLIDTNAIYLSTNKNDRTDLELGNTMYSFYRFFQNGRLVRNHSGTHFPKNFDINNVNSGTIGYYKLEKNEITVEIFVPIGSGGYDKIVGEIKNDTIRFNKRLSWIYGFPPRINSTSFLYKVKDPSWRFYGYPDW